MMRDVSNGVTFPGAASRRCPQQGSRVAASSLPPAAPVARGHVAAGLTLPEEAAALPAPPQPRSGCIFEVGDFLTPPLREC